MKTAVIRWADGMLFCDWADGTRQTEPWDQPITPSTDSHEIADLFGDSVTVEHDGDAIHVTYK